MEIPRWVWEEPGRLTCPGEWRVTTRPADGVPEHPDGRHLQAVIFGRAEQFRSRDRIDEALCTLRERLGLDPDHWAWQAPFYRAFFASFFAVGDGSAPAWLKIAGSRLSFRRRLGAVRAKATHTCGSAHSLFAARHLGRETLVLNNLNLPTGALLMKGRAGAGPKDLRLYSIAVHRLLDGDGLGEPLSCYEDWLFLGTPDAEERKARRRGQNLTLQEYPAADPAGRMSPLVSLCRLTGDRNRVVSRCVSLCPGSGEALDFRSVTHGTPFYFRSDLSNAALLARVFEPGLSETFAHG